MTGTQRPVHGQKHTVAFDVKKPDDKDTGCRVAFQPVPQNARLTQDDINAFTATAVRM
jgi:hypothetical protein